MVKRISRGVRRRPEISEAAKLFAEALKLRDHREDAIDDDKACPGRGRCGTCDHYEELVAKIASLLGISTYESIRSMSAISSRRPGGSQTRSRHGRKRAGCMSIYAPPLAWSLRGGWRCASSMKVRQSSAGSSGCAQFLVAWLAPVSRCACETGNGILSGASTPAGARRSAMFSTALIPAIVNEMGR